MYCVVLAKIQNFYILRHIIYDISPEEDLEEVKKKYYADYQKIDTDEFYLCHSKKELDKVLSRYKLS